MVTAPKPAIDGPVQPDDLTWRICPGNGALRTGLVGANTATSSPSP